MPKTCDWSPDKTIQELIRGNERFAAGKSALVLTRLQQVRSSCEDSCPRAAVLTCADSRLSPDAIFDCAIGDLFVVRNAGNIVDATVLGSLEYAVASQKAPAIVVMGHTLCGAVTTAVSQPQQELHISNIMECLQPALEAASKIDPLPCEDHISQAVRLNVTNSIIRLINESKIISQRVNDKSLNVVGAIYDVHTGRVNWL